MVNAGGIIILLLQVVFVLCTGEYLQSIYIDPSAGNDTDLCYSSDSPQQPCKTLDYAFQYRNSSTQYALLASNNVTYTLRDDTIFRNLQNIGFSGSNGGATVECAGENTGLSFLNVSSIAITNITFLSCSATRNSTSRNFFAESFQLYMFKVALYFYLCEDVEMVAVNVSFSPNATGVVMYDTRGTNSIRDSVFANNSVMAARSTQEGTPTRPGGGGFYVEFTFCIPGDNSCNDKEENVADENFDVHYEFTNCVFSNNSASNEGSQNKSTYIVPYRSTHQAFGRGGGLSVFIKGSAKRNVFYIRGCRFENNMALWGGGLFVEFHDETANNSVFVEGCVLVNNHCSFTLKTGTGGGGMRIGHYVYNHFRLNHGDLGNRIQLSDSEFVSNSAMYGGGLSISPTLQETTHNGSEGIILLKNVTFRTNVGKLGAALHIGIFPLITSGVMLDMIINSCTFKSNSAHYISLLADEGEGVATPPPHTVGIGAVYINYVHVIFEGDTLFHHNKGTALAVAGESIDITNSALNFTHNTGSTGGAISLLGASYILINEETWLHFKSNSATFRGGAIFNRYIEMDNLMTHSNCFIRHVDPFVVPDEWNATFEFIDNTDHNGHSFNSIHTSSILPCAWAGGNGYIVDISKIFCWRNWSYYSASGREYNCSNQITSAAGELKMQTPSYIQAVSGKKFKIPLTVKDDYGTDVIQEIVFSATSNVTNAKNAYFWGADMSLSGVENTFMKTTMQSLGDRVWEVDIISQLLKCPPGLTPSRLANGSETADTVCECSDTFLGTVLCNPDTLKVKMNDRNWIGWTDGQCLAGLCPSGYCATTNTSFVDLPNMYEELDGIICSSGREGIMCGECVEGYGPAVNSPTYDCVNCTDINLASNIVKYVASVYLPLAALFTVLIVFDIRLTTGPANAFILYCQVVTSTFSLDADGQIPLNRITHSNNYDNLLKAYKTIYGVLNLEFVENLLSPLCLSPRMNTLSVLVLDYGVAFFPLVLIFLITFLVWLCGRCTCSCLCCFPRTLRTPTHVQRGNISTTSYGYRRRRISEALLPAFAAFILLSYTKFSITSSYLMGTQALVDEHGGNVYPSRVYFAGQYKSTDREFIFPYLLPAVFVFATFVSITPLLLLVYPLKAFEWCLSRVNFLWRLYPVIKIHVFLDTFQGCYKNNMRYFAGLYFLFRLVINVVYLATDTWLGQFVVQQIACVVMATLVSMCQPYSVDYHFLNYVDALMFANLAILNALSLYLYVSFLRANTAPPPHSAFIAQCVLVFLPLLYMTAYLLWYLVKKRRNTWLVRKLHEVKLRLKSTATFKSLERVVGNEVSVAAATKSLVALEDSEEDEDEAFFARAEMTNRYQRVRDREESGRGGGGHCGVQKITPGGGDSRTSKTTTTSTTTTTTRLSSRNSKSRSTGHSSPGYGSMSNNCSFSSSTPGTSSDRTEP